MVEVILTGILTFTLGYIAAYIKLIHYQQRAETALKECASILKVIAQIQELKDKLQSDRSKEDRES